MRGGKVMWRLLSVLAAALAFLVLQVSDQPTVSASSNCQFVLGFKAIRDAMPDVVGNCLVNEHHNPANGDGLQETSGKGGSSGLMVWRKADNWTAYTDGYRTWINGPNGLQQRLNTERFPWEKDPVPPAFSLVVNSVKRQDSINSFQKVSPGQTYLILDVTIENTRAEKVYYNPLHFRAKGPDIYERTANLVVGDNSLKSGYLKAGEQVRGDVFFLIPQGMTGFAIRFDPVLFGLAPIDITVN
jgi:hypothetical protein